MLRKLHDNNPSDSGDSIGGFLYEVVKMLILAVVIVVPIRIFLFQPFIVRGASMEPNFAEKEYLIINEFGYKYIDLFDGALTIEPRKDLARGEIIVFREPVGDHKDFYIKRVIGVPGETVEVVDGKVTIYNADVPSGFLLDEDAYLPKNRRTLGQVKYTLTDDQYFVLGDNRNASSDSRRFGPITKNDVIGKVLFRAYPLNKIGFYN
jgi:signal peptidase I